MIKGTCIELRAIERSAPGRFSDRMTPAFAALGARFVG